MSISDLEKSTKEFALDKRSGATKLALKTVDIYRKYVSDFVPSDKTAFLERLSELGKLLRNAQPSMTSISNLAAFIYEQADLNAKKADLPELRSCMLASLASLKKQIANAKHQIAQQALNLIPENAIIITHSQSSTVQEILEQAYTKKKLSRVILSEGRPLQEGLRVAENLLKLGIPVTVVVDAAMGHFCKEADLALVGADTIQNDGSVVNKVGTYLLAMACHNQKKPFYVACDTLKLSRTTDYEQPVTIRPKPQSEIINPKKLAGADIRNIYFDVTPPQIITKIITERGIFPPEDIGNQTFAK